MFHIMILFVIAVCYCEAHVVRRPQGSRCSLDLKPLVGGAPRPVVVPLQPNGIPVFEQDSQCHDVVSQCVKEPRRARVYILFASSSSQITLFQDH